MRNKFSISFVSKFIMLFALLASPLAAEQTDTSVNLKFTGFKDGETERDIYVLDLEPLKGISVTGKLEVEHNTVTLKLESDSDRNLEGVEVANFSDYYGLSFVRSSTEFEDSNGVLLKKIHLFFDYENPELAFDLKDNVLYIARSGNHSAPKTNLMKLDPDERLNLFKHLFNAGVLFLCGTNDEDFNRGLYEFSNGYIQQTSSMGKVMGEGIRDGVSRKYSEVKTNVVFMSENNVLKWFIPSYIGWTVAEGLITELVKGTWQSVKSLDDLLFGSIAGAQACYTNFRAADYTQAGRSLSDFGTNSGTLAMILWGGKQMINPLKKPASKAAKDALDAAKAAAQNIADGGTPPFAGALAGGGSEILALEGTRSTVGAAAGSTAGAKTAGGLFSMYWGGRSGGGRPDDDVPERRDSGQDDLLDDPDKWDLEDLDPDDLQYVHGIDPDDLTAGMAHNRGRAAARIADDPPDLSDMDVAKNEILKLKGEGKLKSIVFDRPLRKEMSEVVTNTKGILPSGSRELEHLLMLVRAVELQNGYGRIPRILRIRGKIPGATKKDATTINMRVLAVEDIKTGGKKKVMVLEGDNVLSLETFLKNNGLDGALADKHLTLSYELMEQHIRDLRGAMSPILDPEYLARGLNAQAREQIENYVNVVNGYFR